jgi:hypothetical protein
MARYTVRAWATDDVLATVPSLAAARRSARQLLDTPRMVRQADEGPGSIPAGALEGYHASHREGCASVLICREE